jgi:hypothetical protein
MEHLKRKLFLWVYKIPLTMRAFLKECRLWMLKRPVAVR